MSLGSALVFGGLIGYGAYRTSANPKDFMFLLGECITTCEGGVAHRLVCTGVNGAQRAQNSLKSCALFGADIHWQLMLVNNIHSLKSSKILYTYKFRTPRWGKPMIGLWSGSSPVPGTFHAPQGLCLARRVHHCMIRPPMPWSGHLSNAGSWFGP